MSGLKYSVFLAAAVFVVAFSHVKGDCKNVGAEVEARINQYTTAVNANDKAALEKLFESRSTFEIKQRTENVTTIIRKLLSLDHLDLTVERVECGTDSVPTGCARIAGQMTAKFHANEEATKGRYEHIWCKIDGQWELERIIADCNENGSLC